MGRIPRINQKAVDKKPGEKYSLYERPYSDGDEEILVAILTGQKIPYEGEGIDYVVAVLREEIAEAQARGAIIDIPFN